MINPGCIRSDLVPNIDKTTYLKIYCKVVNNKNENEFLSNIYGIGDLILYDNFNIYKKQKILESDFNFIEICVKNQDNKIVELKDFWQISVYIDKIYG